MTDFLPIPPQSKAGMATSLREENARLAAQRLEATFLAEMLKAAGFGEQENSLSGGPGEDQFASFHRQAVADKIAASGGLGLAEHFFRAMMETPHDR